MEAVLFYILSIILIASVAGLITRRNPLYSALWLAVFLLGAGLWFALLGSPILTALLIFVVTPIVLAFNIVSIFVAGGHKPETNREIDLQKIAGLLLTSIVGFALFVGILRPPFEEGPITGPSYRSLETIISIFSGSYMTLTILVGAILIVGLFGALTIVKKSTEVR